MLRREEKGIQLPTRTQSMGHTGRRKKMNFKSSILQKSKLSCCRDMTWQYVVSIRLLEMPHSAVIPSMSCSSIRAEGH